MATAALYFGIAVISGGVLFWLYRTLVSLPAKASSDRISAIEIARAKSVGEIVKEKEDEARKTNPIAVANRELDRLSRRVPRKP